MNARARAPHATPVSGWLLGTGLLLSCESSDPNAARLADASVENAVPVLSAPPAPPAAPAQPTATRAPAPVPLQILRLTFTSAVRNKEPVDKLEAASPGQRVYAHLAVRNRSQQARRLRLFFEVNENPRTELELTVEPSWSYRTWAYNTVLASDTKGELTLVVTDEEGKELTTARLPIRR